MDWGIDLRKNEFRTLLHFFIALVMIFLLEMMLSPLIEGVLFPDLWKLYGVVTPENLELKYQQKIMLEGSGIFLMLLWFSSVIIPAPFREWAMNLGQGLEQMITLVIPQIKIDLWSSQVQVKDALQLFGLSLLLLLLQLLPYVIAGLYFMLYVVRNGKRIREEDRKRQEKLDRERNLMLSDIAHDIRNPMTTISGYAQALDEGIVRDPVKQAEYFHTIRKKSDRVEELLSLLFDYAKLNSTGYSLNKEQLDLCEFLRQIAAQLYLDVEDADMELIPEIPNTKHLAYIDRTQFTRVITNLVTNSIRYNPKGTKILIRLTIDPNDWEDDRIIICDTGNEISRATEERLFEPFSRGDTSRPTDGGSGLGLSIVKSIVELHGAKIVYRRDIVGYTKGFEIRLPG